MSVNILISAVCCDWTQEERVFGAQCAKALVAIIEKSRVVGVGLKSIKVNFTKSSRAYNWWCLSFSITMEPCIGNTTLPKTEIHAFLPILGGEAGADALSLDRIPNTWSRALFAEYFIEGVVEKHPASTVVADISAESVAIGLLRFLWQVLRRTIEERGRVNAHYRVITERFIGITDPKQN